MVRSSHQDTSRCTTVGSKVLDLHNLACTNSPFLNMSPLHQICFTFLDGVLQSSLGSPRARDRRVL